jgi:hypothetical protein
MCSTCVGGAKEIVYLFVIQYELFTSLLYWDEIFVFFSSVDVCVKSRVCMYCLCLIQCATYIHIVPDNES